MIHFKGLILVACFVAALGFNTKRQEEKEVGRHVTFADGFVCTLICQNRPDIIGRTAKCFITHEEKVHTTLIRNPGYGVWLFYTVDDVDVEEDELCEEVVVGDAFRRNETETICPSSAQYVNHHITVDLSKGKNVRSSLADTSDRNDNGDMKTLIDKLNGAVNRVFRSIGVTTKGFAQTDEGANAVARKVVETMNHLKEEVELLAFEAASDDFPFYDPQDDYQKENKGELLEEDEEKEEEEYNHLMTLMNKRSDDDHMSKKQDSKDVYRKMGSFIDRLVHEVENIVKTIIDDVESALDSSEMSNHYSPNDEKEEYSDDLEKDGWPSPPSAFRFRGDDSSQNKKKGLSYNAPPTFPPYNPTDFRQRSDDSSRNKKGFSYIAPPTSPPYNPNDFKQRHEPEDLDDDWPTRPSVSKQRGYDPSKYKKKGFSHVAPPTPPPYNPNDFSHQQEPEEYDKDGDWSARSSAPKQRGDGSSKYNKEFHYIAPPTFPPYNPNDYKREHESQQFDEEADWPNHHNPNQKRGEEDNLKYPPHNAYPPNSVSSLKKRNGGNDIIGIIKSALEELKNQYKNSDEDSLIEIVENLYEEIIQLEDAKKSSAAQPESAYPFLVSPIAGAVAEGIDRVKRNSQKSEETDQTLNAQYHPLDFDSMDALCGLMTTRLCEETKLLHCKEDKTCCWAHIDPSVCSESNYGEFTGCYTGLSNILDTLMTQ